MNMFSNFKVGDRVVLNTKNMLGTVIDIVKAVEINGDLNDEKIIYAVESDEYEIFFHTCRGRCEDGHGVWVSEEGIRSADNNNRIKLLRDVIDVFCKNGIEVQNNWRAELL